MSINASHPIATQDAIKFLKTKCKEYILYSDNQSEVITFFAAPEKTAANELVLVKNFNVHTNKIITEKGTVKKYKILKVENCWHSFSYEGKMASAECFKVNIIDLAKAALMKPDRNQTKPQPSVTINSQATSSLARNSIANQSVTRSSVANSNLGRGPAEPTRYESKAVNSLRLSPSKLNQPNGNAEDELSLIKKAIMTVKPGFLNSKKVALLHQEHQQFANCIRNTIYDKKLFVNFMVSVGKFAPQLVGIIKDLVNKTFAE